MLFPKIEELFPITSFYTHDIFFQQNFHSFVFSLFDDNHLGDVRCCLDGFLFPWWVLISRVFLTNNTKIADHLSLGNFRTDTPFIWFFIFPIKILIYFDITSFSDVQFTNNFSYSEDYQLAASIVSLKI